MQRTFVFLDERSEKVSSSLNNYLQTAIILTDGFLCLCQSYRSIEITKINSEKVFVGSQKIAVRSVETLKNKLTDYDRIYSEVLELLFPLTTV